MSPLNTATWWEETEIAEEKHTNICRILTDRLGQKRYHGTTA